VQVLEAGEVTIGRHQLAARLDGKGRQVCIVNEVASRIARPTNPHENAPMTLAGGLEARTTA